MAESVVAGSAAKTLLTPKPGATLFKAWQGFVEFGLRVAVLVLAVLALIAAGVANSENQFSDLVLGTGNMFQDIRTARNGVLSSSGWIIFVAIIALVLESLILAVRFLNFGFMESYGTIFFIVDIVISAVFAGAYLVGAIALAVYAESWRGLTIFYNNFPGTPIEGGQIISSTGAASAFSFFSVFVCVALGVWMVLTLLLKWGNGGKYDVKTTTVKATD